MADPPPGTPPIQWSVLHLGLWGTLTGTFFAIGLALFARFGERVALSKPLAMVLGASSGALAYSLLLGPLLEGPGFPYLIATLAVYGTLGLITGEILWSVASKGEETEEATSPDQAAIQAPSIVDGTAFRWDATPEPQSSPRSEPRSPTS